MITKLEKIANEQRAEHLARNEYKYTNSYGSTHPNALSTGDEKGKGQVGDSGDVGGLTDINTRIDNTGRNYYQPHNQYGVTHENALSTGDEKGKGQVGDSGDVGGLTDINTRIDNTGRNFYKSTHRYPDFEF